MKGNSDFQKKMADLLPEILMRFDEPLSKHTSFRIGGPVQAMAFPKNPEQLADLLKVSKLLDVTPRILGAGTNVLAPDEAVPGLVICLKDCMDGIMRLDGDRICVAAGVTMARAAVFAANQGLSGLEFAHGIPGTVGGGVYMNAGAYDGDISQVCTCAEIMHMDGRRAVWDRSQLDFSYRHSRLEEEKAIVVSAEFQLSSAEPDIIREKMTDLMSRRRASQPLEYPSAGSAFKRPQGGYAAALIQQAGLKGYSVGGAQVSEKHAGFVINRGNASSKDVRRLLQEVADRVFAECGIQLEPEVRIW